MGLWEVVQEVAMVVGQKVVWVGREGGTRGEFKG